MIHHVCVPDWEWDCSDATSFNGFLLWLVDGGETLLESQYGTHKVTRGDLLLMPGVEGAFYHGQQDPHNPLSVSWMHLHPTQNRSSGVSGTLLNAIGFRQTLSDPEFAGHLMRRVLSSRASEQTLWLNALLHEAVRDKISTAQQTPAERFISHLCDLIHDDPARYRRLSDLPMNRVYSKDHLIRLFKKQCGIPPGEFMIRARIDRAKKLLKIPGMEIKLIALDLGYPDPYTFSKQFKSCTGLAPGRFRDATFVQSTEPLDATAERNEDTLLC